MRSPPRGCRIAPSRAPAVARATRRRPLRCVSARWRRWWRTRRRIGCLARLSVHVRDRRSQDEHAAVLVDGAGQHVDRSVERIGLRRLRRRRIAASDVRGDKTALSSEHGNAKRRHTTLKLPTRLTSTIVRWPISPVAHARRTNVSSENGSPSFCRVRPAIAMPPQCCRISEPASTAPHDRAAELLIRPSLDRRVDRRQDLLLGRDIALAEDGPVADLLGDCT